MADGLKNLDLDEMLSNNILPENESSISEQDQKHQWHPYTQMKDFGSHLPVVEAKGSVLTLENGKTIIDAISSWWVNTYGHGHPHIQQAVANQIGKLDHVLFAGFTHPAAIKLADKLLPLLPGNFNRLFFSDNGSTSVEVAMKMALQYFYNKGNKKRRVLLAFENAYHGDTFGAMATGGLGVFNSAFSDMLPTVKRIPIPEKGREEEALKALDNIDFEEVCGFIYEPLVQGAAGMQFYKASALDPILKKIKEAGAFLIADEVMTGFGRLGTMFASEQTEIKPDIMCLSKGLTAGVLPMGLTVATEEVYRGFYDDDKSKALMHGHSFTANPIGCAAAIAGLELWESYKFQQQRKDLMERQAAFAKKLEEHPMATNIRVSGTLLALDVRSDENSNYHHGLRDKLYAYFIEQGVLIRPLGNVLYVLPPYTITESELQQVHDSIWSCLDEIEKR